MKRKLKRKPLASTIPSSSLPDIIFILLFFFMVATVVRPELQVNRLLPQAIQLQKLSPDPHQLHFYVGWYGDNTKVPWVQLNGSLITVGELSAALFKLYPGKSHEQRLVILEIDQNVPMQYVVKLQNSLRQVGLRKVMYSVDQQHKEGLQNI